MSFTSRPTLLTSLALASALGSSACASSSAPLAAGSATEAAPAPPEKPEMNEPAPRTYIARLGAPLALEGGYSVTIEPRGHKHGRGFTLSRYAVMVRGPDGLDYEAQYGFTGGRWLFEDAIVGASIALSISMVDALAESEKAMLTTPDELRLNELRRVTVIDWPGARLSDDDRSDLGAERAEEVLASGRCGETGISAASSPSPGTYEVRPERDGQVACVVTLGLYSEVVFVDDPD